MKTLYSTPSSSSASPSRAGSSTPCSSSLLPHAAGPPARAARQSSMSRRRDTRAGILAPRVGAEPGCLLGLIAGDRRSLRRLLLRLLEEHPQAVERLARLAADPTRGADLLEAIDHRGGLAVG